VTHFVPICVGWPLPQGSFSTLFGLLSFLILAYVESPFPPLDAGLHDVPPLPKHFSRARGKVSSPFYSFFYGVLTSAISTSPLLAGKL